MATVAVFAVTGITDRGKDSACAEDHQTLVSSEEAYAADHTGYGTMSELVTGGRLHRSSNLFTITVDPSGNAYTVTGVGDCTGFVAPG